MFATISENNTLAGPPSLAETKLVQCITLIAELSHGLSDLFSLMLNNLPL